MSRIIEKSYEAVFDPESMEFKVENLSYKEAVVIISSIGFIGPADVVKYTRHMERVDAIEEIYRAHNISILEVRKREYEIRFSADMAAELVDKNKATIQDVNACSNELQSDYNSIW